MLHVGLGSGIQGPRESPSAAPAGLGIPAQVSWKGGFAFSVLEIILHSRAVQQPILGYGVAVLGGRR